MFQNWARQILSGSVIFMYGFINAHFWCAVLRSKVNPVPGYGEMAKRKIDPICREHSQNTNKYASQLFSKQLLNQNSVKFVDLDQASDIMEKIEIPEQNHSHPPPEPLVEHFKSLEGLDGKKNDVLYVPPVNSDGTIVVFFGGDIQDLPNLMTTFTAYNLQATALLLHRKFPSSHIVIIRPSRFVLTYSCFDNFVPCNGTGVPEHTPYHGAIKHLELLINSLNNKIEKSEVSSTTGGGKLNGKMKLVGFSKGCVVLNQFLYEFHYLKTLTPDSDHLDAFISSIHGMYWLDGGHSGGKNTWITARSLLETLKRLNIAIHVHMTPYQLNDERRPWIAREEKLFSENLVKYGARVNRRVHFDGIPGGRLEMHFKLLESDWDAETEQEEEERDDLDDFDEDIC